ncbi:alpha/beta hydrolase [Pseudomonadales bacterium]|nr:alpha/beta hydrolase [Pseudomonadales bacterium]
MSKAIDKTIDKTLPGKLGNPNATFETDSRADPRIAAVMAMAGELAPGVVELAADATYEESLAYAQAFEEAAALTHPLKRDMMPDFPSVEATTQVIKGVDGNDINLYLHQPAQRSGPLSGPLPCVVHTHGGGMVLMTAADPDYIRWRNSLAAMGVVVVGVEFRNGGGSLGNHPFPAGLNDCASAVQWTHANRGALNISSIVISGESGGGNLSIATTLKALKEGWVNKIDGVYAMCPYISGSYANPPAELVSLKENDGYMLNCAMMATMVRVYDPNGEHGANPLAWPLQASTEDLTGLPPHIISVNELDPLRDEGLVFYRKLLAAGVSAVAKTVHGTPHAGDMSFPDFTPDIYQETARSLHGFAMSLAGS